MLLLQEADDDKLAAVTLLCSSCSSCTAVIVDVVVAGS